MPNWTSVDKCIMTVNWVGMWRVGRSWRWSLWALDMLSLFSTHSLHDQYIALVDACKTAKVLLMHTRHFATQFWRKKDLTIIVSTQMFHSAQAGWLSGHRRRAAFWTFLFILIKARCSVLQMLVSGSHEKEPRLAHPLFFPLWLCIYTFNIHKT